MKPTSSSSTEERGGEVLVNVRGTELLASDTRERYRQKLARITLDSMVQFVGLLDAEGTVLEINHVALDAVGIKLSDVEGKPFWTTFWWQVSEEINSVLRESIQRASQGEFVRWDAEIYGRSGGKETIIIDASLMPVKDDQGKVVFITAEGRDITEKKAHEREIARQREELAKLDELKTQFFANISHEFRTPLTLMMGPLEDAIAQPEGLPSATREQLQLAHRNSLRLLKLVNTLLDFSRIEAGRIQASYQPTDLALLTGELASVFRSAIERAEMKLAIDCAPLSEPVYVDREMWEKIVLNLISNAFKFTFEGEIEVSLREVGASVELTVRDTGTGIPLEEIPRLFDRFHRVKGARGRSYEGSGIGLALVQELVKLHGGYVRVESQVDRGTIFIVSIPRGKSHLPADRIAAEQLAASTGVRNDAYVEEVLRWLPDAPRKSKIAETFADRPLIDGRPESLPPPGSARTQRILLGDDNADMRDYVRRLLVQSGYEVEAVPDGLAALSAARARKPDLVLTDVMMPGLDGFGLLRELRADAELGDIPIILLSARAGEEARIEGMHAGADDYLIKPFSARELLARVESHLKMARFRHETAQAVRLRTAQFETLLNQAPLGVYVVDGNFRIRQVNPIAHAAFGNVPDLIGRDFDEMIHVLWPRAYAAEIVARFRHTLETGEPHIVSERIEERRDRGVREYYEWRVNRIQLPEGTFGVVCYFRDISAQVLAREEIREAADRLRFMAESMPQKIFTATPNGDYDYLNQQWMDFTGLSFELMKNAGWTQFIHPDDVDEHIRLWKHAIATGEPFQFVHRVRRADGLYRWHLSRARAMRDSAGDVTMWIGSNTEIHEQKQIEEQLRRLNDDLNQFAFAASHDLQEPLRMVTSYSQLLVQSCGDQLGEEPTLCVGFIEEGTRRMRTLLADLLAYTQVAVPGEESIEEVDTNLALENAIKNLEAAIEESEAVVTHGRLPRIAGRSIHFVQVFQNLIGNAIKYRGASSARIHVSAGKRKNEWQFAVKDNGMGIEEQYHKTIFGVFKRLHGKAIPGTGIGLAICQRVVERYGGRIWVESKPGEGATFYFTMPLLEGENR